MNFLHMWALGIGAFALALPVAIHVLTRPRPVLLPLSTIRFVEELVHDRRRWDRLKELLILLLRMLAVLLLALTLARPLLRDRSPAAVGTGGKVSRVVILDVSQSMAALAQGIELMQQARAAAADYLRPQSNLSANLILASAKPRSVFDRPGVNLAALSDELAKSRVRPERLNAQAALSRAVEMLTTTGAPKERRELVVISDFQRSNWSTIDLSQIPGGIDLELKSVASAEQSANLALLGLRAAGRAEVGTSIPLELDVGNFSSAAREVRADVALGTSTVHFEGLCTPAARTTLISRWTPTSPGPVLGEARLIEVEDALEADNRRPVVLWVDTKPTYLLLTHQSPDEIPSASYYLERGLAPSLPGAGDDSEDIRRVNPAKADRELLATSDVIVVDHPGKLRDESLRSLVALVRRGRGLLYIAAESIDADNLAQLALFAGADLQLPIEYVRAPADRPRRELFLVDVRADRAPFHVFGDDALNIAGSLRFSGGLDTRRRGAALRTDVLAVLSDQSAFLLVSGCGAGTLAIVNADLGTSTLTRDPAFVPLLGELVARLLERGTENVNAFCGEPSANYLPAEISTISDLATSRPASSGADSLLSEQNLGVLWQIPEPDVVGTYAVRQNEHTIFALAAAAPPDESDLSVLGPGLIKERLANARPLRYLGVSDKPRDEDRLWIWAAAALVGCLVFELSALRLTHS